MCTATCAGWTNSKILDWFAFELLAKANKIMAFALGMHVRLGVASHVSLLNELVLVMIGMCPGHVCCSIVVACVLANHTEQMCTLLEEFIWI